MHDEAKAALKQAIERSLPVLQSLQVTFSEPYLVWKRTGDGQWHGEYQQRPSLRGVSSARNTQLDEAAADFVDRFLFRHPEYGEMVGAPRFGAMQLTHDKTYLLRSALSRLWDQCSSFVCDESAINAVVEDFAEFVDSRVIRYRFQAQLLNYQMSVVKLELPNGLTIRKLSEEEVSQLHGGPIDTLGMIRPRSFGPHEFVIEGEHEEPKSLGDSPNLATPTPDPIKSELDKAILCLRTFKEGHVGYDYVHFRPLKFCPLPTPSYGFGDLYVPFGSYTVTEEEIPALRAYAELLLATSEPAMEMACSRLADAETRTRAQDRIVDAVIGLEALLLAGLSKEDRKGELKYRFSLHYSTLFGSPEERFQAFRVAKDLYDLRSAIAHGSGLQSQTHRVGTERLTLIDVAKRATSALRIVIQRFLPEARSAPYKRHEFWDRAYFGLGNRGEQ